MKRMQAILVFPALFGACATTPTWRPTCVEESTPVGDDEVTDLGFSAATALGRSAMDADRAGTWADGGAADLHVTVARGSGTAELVLRREDAEAVATRPSLLPGDEYLLVEVECSDFLRVPLDVSVRSADGDLDFAEGASLVTADHLEVAAATLDVPFDGAGVPAPSGVDTEAWTDQEAFLNISWSLSTETGHLGWQASNPPDEEGASSQSISRTIVTWEIDGG